MSNPKSFKPGDRVIARTDIIWSGGTIAKGSRGMIMEQHPDPDWDFFLVRWDASHYSLWVHSTELMLEPENRAEPLTPAARKALEGYARKYLGRTI